MDTQTIIGLALLLGAFLLVAGVFWALLPDDAPQAPRQQPVRRTRVEAGEGWEFEASGPWVEEL